MEDLIEQYLFIYRNCPLPSVGSLQLRDGNAVAWHGENKLAAPVPHIEFSQDESPAEGFIAFIAAHRNIPMGEASVWLQKFCIGLQKLNTYNEVKLESTGKFYVDQAGSLRFKEEQLPVEFLPPVSFERVVYTKVASHAIKVGNTETTSEVMTEYYSEKQVVKKKTWWIAALIIFLATAGLLVFYFIDPRATANFGNKERIDTNPAHATYHTN